MEFDRHTPFPGRIIPNDLTAEHPRIKAISGTNFLVRTYDLPGSPKVSREVLGYYKHAVARWRRLGSYPGIDLPVFTPVIGTADHMNYSFLILTERISGQNLENVIFHHSELPQAKRACDTFISSLAQYSHDVYAGRGDYLSDQNLSQYVWSRSGADKKIFFVDLGLEHHVLPEDKGQHPENAYFFGRHMVSLYGMLEGLEEKLGEPLIQGRVALSDFLGSIPQGSGGVSYAHNLQSMLLQKRFA